MVLWLTTKVLCLGRFLSRKLSWSMESLHNQAMMKDHKHPSLTTHETRTWKGHIMQQMDGQVEMNN